ncbi:alpha/beta hydrolase [Maribacter sp. 2304DJ31-5]|uniref:alpha/beta hydrolase n=1 Tax=Maribacter sp. 2304DJ31-5 TaxID=3386273 RepID=UPI0039BCFD48
MRKTISFLFFAISLMTLAQERRLVKGVITDNVVVTDSTTETFALYLPRNFEMARAWPIVFVFDMDGKGKQAISMFKEAAEEEGYILAGSNNTNDSLTLSQNVLVAKRMFNEVFEILPIGKNRSYTAGFSDGARFASVIPNFIRDISGVISCGASIGNVEILNAKRPFHFIGVVGRSDYNYIDLRSRQNVLNKLRFPNQLVLFEGGSAWPSKRELATALKLFSLNAMAKGVEKRDDDFVSSSYTDLLTKANTFLTEGNPLLSDYLLSDMIKIYHPLRNTDSLKVTQKALRRSKSFRTNKRIQNNYFLKETFTRDDYSYYLEEDVITYNYNNLGWWNYQMSELRKIEKSNNPFEKRMGKRLCGYLNALIEDNIDIITAEKVVDNEALNFLFMLKTITDPMNYQYYFKIISNSCKIEDYGTALFYLEELLKKGYKDKSKLYSLEDAALFRITPEFNALIDKYLER